MVLICRYCGQYDVVVMTCCGAGAAWTLRADRLLTTRAVQGVSEVLAMTADALQREVLADPLLTAFSVVTVDAVHERSAASDLLLGLLRKVPSHRWCLAHRSCTLYGVLTLPSSRKDWIVEFPAIKNATQDPVYDTWSADVDSQATARAASDPLHNSASGSQALCILCASAAEE